MLSGARCVGTLLHEMKRRGKDCRFGVVSMCIGENNYHNALQIFSFARISSCLLFALGVVYILLFLNIIHFHFGILNIL